MNSHRTLTGVLALMILGMGAWIVSLQGQISDLEAQLSEAPEIGVSSASMPEGDDGPQRVHQWNPRAHRGPGAPGSMVGAPGPAGENDEAETAGGEDGEEKGPDWEAMRAEMQANTIETVEAFGTQNGWSPETTDEVVAILLDTGDAIGEVWASVRDGELTHYQARKEMRTLHDESGQDIIALIGEPAYEQLEEHLFEARHDAWRRSGEGSRRH